jgi:glycosyltransferase involved in cell wall biosynthesis
MAPENTNRISTDLWASIRNLRVFCVGNGGVLYREGQLWSYRFIGDFLAEMGGLVREICFCGWLEPTDDTMAQTVLQHIPGVRAVGLPPFHGPVLRKLTNGICSFAILTREVARADFVYVYWPGRLSSITARLCRTLGKPYGIYFRGEQIDSDPSFATTFGRARFVLTTGNVLRTIAQAYCGDVENVTPMTSVRLEHVLAPRPPRLSGPWHLLYVGRFEECKGVEDLLAAVSYLDEWSVPFVLTMVGHCQDQDRLLRQLPPSVALCVRMIGAVSEFEDLIPMYRAADAFVLPSHEEGFPRVLYEAMAFGVPILTTFVGGIPTVMKDAQNCLRIEVRNPKDIADKIRHLLTHPELQAQIAWSAHECISELMKTWQRSHPVQIAERLRDLVTRRA